MRSSLGAAWSNLATGYLPHTQWGRKYFLRQATCAPISQASWSGKTREEELVGFESTRTLVESKWYAIQKFPIFHFCTATQALYPLWHFQDSLLLAFLLGCGLPVEFSSLCTLRKLHISPESRNSFVWLLVLQRRMPRKDLEISWNMNDKFTYSKVLTENKLREVGRQNLN